jgi:hypothetical protein
MRPGKRFGLSAIEKSDIWGRWKAGQSLHEIGRAFDKPHSSIRCLLLPRGGIPPAARRRSRLALTLAEREDISGGLASGSPLREIARRLDRAASRVTREISRHGGRPAYRAHVADDHAWDSASRPKKCLVAVHRKLRNIVASKLILEWSPEQISGWLKTQYPDDESMRVSQETLYRSLFIQARGVLKKELMGHLRSKRRMRRSRHAGPQGTIPWPDRRCHLDPRKTCGSGRPSDSWSLGRRSAERCQEQLSCDTGRTPFTLCHADQGTQQRDGSCGCCFESTWAQTPRNAETLADVGPRTGDGETQGVYGSYGCAGVLLRSAKSLAARHERKHQSAVTAILPSRHRPVWLFASAARPGLAALESTPKKNLKL